MTPVALAFCPPAPPPSPLYAACPTLPRATTVMRGRTDRRPVRVLRSLAKWAVLAAVAVVLGSLLGAAVATSLKDPVPAEATAPVEGPDDALESAAEVPEQGLADTTAPPPPVLVAPADGAYASLQPLFRWEAVADASNVIYAIEWSHDPGFPPEASITVRNLEGTAWKADTAFAPLAKVYWRMYALDAGLNQSSWSEAQSFTPLFPIGDLEVGAGVEGLPPILH